MLGQRESLPLSYLTPFAVVPQPLNIAALSAAPLAFAFFSARMRNVTARRSLHVTVDIVGPSRGRAGPIPCVVTSPWGESPPPETASARRALINPANTQLVGTSLPYFPRGGPLPPPPPPGLRVSSGWGGMEAGSSMLYPSQAVDGLTHLHAGPELRVALATTQRNARGQRCAVGCAVVTPAFKLKHFDLIAHTPTPFWCTPTDQIAHAQWREQLISCYLSSVLAVLSGTAHAVEYGSSLVCLTSSLSVLHSNHAVSCIATPLLGSGTGGAPVAAAVKVAADAVSRLRSCDLHTQLMLRFVSNDSAAFEELIPAFSH